MRMLTALAMTSVMSTTEMSDWRAIVSLAHRANGMTSVGLNASAVVSPRYK